MACAIASRCNTAFVDPPRAITTTIAFSNDSLVIMSEGLISLSSKFITANPASKQSFCLSLDIAS